MSASCGCSLDRCHDLDLVPCQPCRDRSQLQARLIQACLWSTYCSCSTVLVCSGIPPPNFITKRRMAKLGSSSTEMSTWMVVLFPFVTGCSPSEPPWLACAWDPQNCRPIEEIGSAFDQGKEAVIVLFLFHWINPVSFPCTNPNSVSLRKILNLFARDVRVTDVKKTNLGVNYSCKLF